MKVLIFAKTIIKNLFSRPATRMYPTVAKKYFPRARGQVAINIDECIFCSICARKCPTGAINVSKDDKSWEIERLRCIQCNSCVDLCPKKCLSMLNAYTPVSTSSSVKDGYNARVSDNG
jgi:formate hydrogenlyase subunit 6/NADH:ubiquinone oxidoreductase subunit I